MSEYKSLAEMGIQPVNRDDKAYWTSFEHENGSIGTWSAYAQSSDEFVEKLLQQDRHIKRFLDFEEQVEGWPAKKNPRIAVGKYNRRLSRIRASRNEGNKPQAGGKTGTGYGPHGTSFEVEQAYRRGFHQALSLVVMLLDKQASLEDIHEWERKICLWRNSLTELTKTVTTPDMFMPKSLGELIYKDYKPRRLA